MIEMNFAPCTERFDAIAIQIQDQGASRYFRLLETGADIIKELGEVLLHAEAQVQDAVFEAGKEGIHLCADQVHSFGNASSKTFVETIECIIEAHQRRIHAWRQCAVAHRQSSECQKTGHHHQATAKSGKRGTRRRQGCGGRSSKRTRRKQASSIGKRLRDQGNRYGLIVVQLTLDLIHVIREAGQSDPVTDYRNNAFSKGCGQCQDCLFRANNGIDNILRLHAG